MITITGSVVVLVALAALLAVNRAAALAAFFLLFPLLTRTAALTYVDLAGPLYAIELEEEVGGGPSMPLFAAAVLAFIVPLTVMFRPSRIASLLPVNRSVLQVPLGIIDLVLVLVSLFVVGLYADMFWRGTIPLFYGIDRLDYNREFAGPLHPYVFDFGFMLASVVGAMMVYPRLQGREFDFRFLFIYLAIIVYYALTGNRFSAFFSFSSFFIIPLAAVPLLSKCGQLRSPPLTRSVVARLLLARTTVMVAIGLLGLLLAGLLTNNLTSVRGYDDPMEQFVQRTVVQPVQLWWTTWRSLSERSIDSDLAWDAVFLDPIDPTRNTSIQALMVKNLGATRAVELLDNGQQYAGGYPEILFEMLHPAFALVVALGFGIVTAWLLRLVLISVARGHLLTAMLATYVFFGFSLLYIGGMLNFLIVWTFWVKCTLLVIVACIEYVLTIRRPVTSGGLG
jgi:hypothetical protein